MYLNTFINLEENITGYGKSPRKPSGHTIITMPGMIRLYLQDLKELSDKEYICYALSKKDNKAVRIGAINPPSESKMTNWRIDINNVLGKGVRADNIDCIAIVIEGDTVGNTDTIMLGYVGEKYLITPLLEKGLPKQEVKVTSEERKDKTPTTPVKPVSKPEAKPMPKPEVKPMPKPEAKPMPKPEAKPVSKPEAKPMPKPEAKPMPKPEVKPVPKPVEEVIIVKPEPCKPVEKPEPVILPEYEPAILPKPKPCKPVEEPKPCKPVEEPEPCKPVEGPGPVILQKPIEEAEILNKFKNKEQKEKENLKQIINQLNESKIDEKEVKKEVEKLKELKKLVKKELKEESVKQPIGEMEILNKFKNKEQKEKENLKQIINKLNEEKAEEEEEVIKKEIKEKSIKKQCGCHKGHKKDIIQKIIEVLERNESNTKDISQVIEDELKELITTGISRDEILNKKNEIELQIKDLLNDKLIVRDNREEKDIENQLKRELNKQFEIGYKLDSEYEEIVDTTEEQEQRIESRDKGIEEREQRMEGQDQEIEEQDREIEKQGKETEEQGQRIEGQDQEIEEQDREIGKQGKEIEEQEQRIEEQETTIEEVDFLEQLEEKLKGLQALLKTNTNEPNKEETNEGVGDIRGSKKVDENKEVSTQKEEYSRIKEIFESSVEIEPFDTETKPIDWVRISLAELISIPQIDYEWAIQPFITFSYHKFNHLILGKDREVNQYYIGIPDIYHQTRNHILEIDKIERFVCRSSDKLETGEPGYWIAMI